MCHARIVIGSSGPSPRTRNPSVVPIRTRGTVHRPWESGELKAIPGIAGKWRKKLAEVVERGFHMVDLRLLIQPEARLVGSGYGPRPTLTHSDCSLADTTTSSSIVNTHPIPPSLLHSPTLDIHPATASIQSYLDLPRISHTHISTTPQTATTDAPSTRLVSKIRRP